MPPPRREDFDTVIRDLEQRIARLERSSSTGMLELGPVTVEPSPPAIGVIVYVYGGALKYVNQSGTRGVIGPA